MSSNAGNVATSNPESERCITVDNTCPGTNLPAPGGDVTKCTYTCPDGTVVPYNKTSDCKQPIATCEYLKVTEKPSWNKRTYEGKFTLTKGAELSKVQLVADGAVVKDFGALTSTSANTVMYSHTFADAGDHSVKLVATAKSGTTYKSGTSCELTESLEKPYSRITQSKGVSNITQKIDDANNKVAKAGDELEYSLIVTNSGNEAAANYIVDSDNLNDVLEYADLTLYDGASYDKTNQRLTWPALTIPASGNVVKKFRVRIKSPIPTTPASVSDPLSFDYKLRNVFGNEVVVSLDKPIVGTTYQAVSEIPNTGPGTSLLISFLAVAVIGYFYARSRLLSKEVGIIRNELGSGV
jgi:uncharacterized repeat protein (TIGR01451 family)